ncbi:MAG: precorrin-8X methylmutase [Synergistaceae bacterium]|nr:precorrin-8X methylmutase [Synergistaceae bacterium]
MRPDEIEQASMNIIASEMGTWLGTPEELPVVKRVIHTTADFDFAENMRFSTDAVKLVRNALKRGTTIVTDTNMAAAGINKAACGRFNVEVVCRMADPAIFNEAEIRSTTRAVVSMEAAARSTPNAVFAIGNAPTALIRLCELIGEGKCNPALVIGVPVGFVNVIESKELLMATMVPYITAVGRKGGSPVASTIVNALLYGIE